MTFWTHEGTLYVEAWHFEVYMLDTNGFDTPEGWTWQVIPWDMFKEKRYSHVENQSELERLRALRDEATARDHEHAIGKYNCLVCFNRRQAERLFQESCVSFVHALLTSEPTRELR